MALLWEKREHDTHYCVRSAGQSIRLYSNGVFHSQWNPNKAFSGAIWDCLSLPVLYQNPKSIKRVLLLGLGGGALVKQLEHLIDVDELIALEIDANHIHVAKHWFDVNSASVSLVHGDAIDWVLRYKGPPFDLVIDDLFGHVNGEPERAQVYTQHWAACLSKLLCSNGMLVANFIKAGEVNRAVPLLKQQGFEQGFRWSQPEYENAVGVFMKQAVASNAWLNNLQASDLSQSLKRCARGIVRRSLNF